MANEVGQALAQPAQAGAPITAQSTATPVPPGMNPIQRLWWQFGNDPAMRRAAQVAAFRLLQGGDSSFAGNVGTAGLAGLQTLENVRAGQADAAREAARLETERQLRERQIADSEARTNIEARRVARGIVEGIYERDEAEKQRKFDESQRTLDRATQERVAGIYASRTGSSADQREIDRHSKNFQTIYPYLTTDQADVLGEAMANEVYQRRNSPAVREKVVNAVMADINIDDADKQAEIDRRMALVLPNLTQTQMMEKLRKDYGFEDPTIQDRAPPPTTEGPRAAPPTDTAPPPAGPPPQAGRQRPSLTGGWEPSGRQTPEALRGELTSPIDVAKSAIGAIRGMGQGEPEAVRPLKGRVINVGGEQWEYVTDSYNPQDDTVQIRHVRTGRVETQPRNKVLVFAK